MSKRSKEACQGKASARNVVDQDVDLSNDLAHLATPEACPPPRSRPRCYWDAILSALADGYTFSVRLAWDRTYDATAWHHAVFTTQHSATLFGALTKVLAETYGHQAFFTSFGCEGCPATTARSKAPPLAELLAGAVAVLGVTRNLTLSATSGSRYTASSVSVFYGRFKKTRGSADAAVCDLADLIRCMLDLQRPKCKCIDGIPESTYVDSCSRSSVFPRSGSITGGLGAKRYLPVAFRATMASRLTWEEAYRHNVPMAGLREDAYLAVASAADRFPEASKDEFLRLAEHAVLSAIAKAESEHENWLLFEKRLHDYLMQVRSAENESSDLMHRQPRSDELALITADLARAILDLLNVDSSIDVWWTSCSAVEATASPRVLAFVDGKRLVEQLKKVRSAYKRQLLPVLGILSERDRYLVTYSEGLNGEYEHTLEELGTMFQVTRERVSCWLSTAKRKLKAAIEEAHSA